MANKIYPLWKEAVIQGAANSSLAGTVKCVLIDAADYSYADTHDFLNDVPSIARVGTPQTLANKTFTLGFFNADDVLFPAVSGDNCEAILIWIDTGNEATSRLVAYIDSGVVGIPVLPGGADVAIVWDSQGIFRPGL